MMARRFKTSLGRNIHYEFVVCKKVNQKRKVQDFTLVFLNGLSDSWHQWKQVVSHLNDEVGFEQDHLFVDLVGQGQSLTQEIESGKKFDYRISVEQQGHALIELCRHLEIEKIVLVGFSYGGGVALWVAQNKPPNFKIEHLVLFLPFLLRLDLAFPLSRLFLFQYGIVKSLTPFFWRAPFDFIEKSYEHFVHDYMHYRFEDRILDSNRREAAIQIAEGAMQFNVFQNLRNLPNHRVILVSSDLDTLIPKSLMQEFWMRLPEEKRRLWVRVTDGTHLILEQNPAFCALLLKYFLKIDKISNPEVRSLRLRDQAPWLDLAID